MCSKNLGLLNIQKKKWFKYLQSTSNLHPFRELLLKFFKLKPSMFRMPVGDPTTLRLKLVPAHWGNLVNTCEAGLSSQFKMFKQNTLLNCGCVYCVSKQKRWLSKSPTKCVILVGKSRFGGSFWDIQRRVSFTPQRSSINPPETNQPPTVA